jgi:hypothetical protein
VVGSPTLVLDGVASLYAMRLLALVLCLAMLVAALRALRAWAEPIVAVAVLCGLTPVVLYSMSLVAPNGLEMMAGLALWTALGAIAKSDANVAAEYVMTALVAASLLLTLRSLGPLWAVLIVVSALIAWPSLVSRLWAMSRTKAGVAALLTLAVVGAGSLAWILGQDSMVVGRAAALPDVAFADRFVLSLRRIPQWIFQTVAAFPSRSDAAPAVVYAAYLALVLSLMGLALRYGEIRERSVLLGVVCTSLAVPFFITMSTVDDFGTAWQGRYGLPYLLGAAVIFGLPLCRLRRSQRQVLVAAAFPLIVIGQTISVTSVLSRERQSSPLEGTAAWSLAPPTAVLVGLVIAGALLAFVPLARSAVWYEEEPPVE